METKAEYEDVLSSIRRLVSEEVRTRAPLAEVKAEPRGDRPVAAVDKLVLTPAQRITPEFPAETPEKPRQAKAAAPLLLRPEEALTEAAEDPSQDAPPADEDPFASFEEVFGADEWQRAPLADSRLASLERTIAELEAVVSDQGHVYEPDGSEEEGSSPEIEPLRVVPPRYRARVWEEAEEAEAAPSATPEMPEAQAIEDATEDTVDELPSFLRSVGAGEAGPAMRDRPDPEMAEAPIAPEPEPDQGFEGDADPMFAAMSDEEDAVLLDEETLRQMVRDLVREELQGVLGERITRNVRKLVRTEIHRIIASQDFE